jgi:hypothetical protein
MAEEIVLEGTEDNKPSPEALAAEEKARKFGWTPKEDFKGDEKQWRTAEEFLQRGEEINGFLRKDLERIQGKNLTLEQELKEVRKAVEEFKGFHEKTAETAYKKALAELQAKKKEAIVVGDGETVIDVENQIEELKEQRVKPEPKKTEDSTDVPDAIYQEQFITWQAENPWFQKDSALRAAASGFADEVKYENPNLKGKAFLEAVTEKVKGAFPDRFDVSPRERHSAVEGNSGGGNRGGSNKKSYADLPSDAKDACDKFVKQGLITKEQYVADYFEG